MLVELLATELRYLFETPIEQMKGKQKYPVEVIKQFKNKIRILMNISNLNELNQFNSLNFEKLKGDLAEKYSIRLNKQYRLIFTVSKETNTISLEIIQIHEISKHYE